MEDYNWYDIFDDEGVCECCGTTDDVSFGPCPFASDVHDDHTPVWLCGNCAHERAMDV